jgi:chondroitin sulfate proteoglycan 4
VTNPRNGFISLAGQAGSPVAHFTQADIEAGRVMFVHDGGDSAAASFDVIVADDSGATSGASQTVHVHVKG